jgi:homoserine acetyltransferase
MTEGVKSDPIWQRTKGDYYHLPKEQQPQKGLMFGWSILNHTAFDFDYVAEQSWDDIKGNVFSWNPKKGEGADLEKRAKDFDANDVIIRNRTCDEYNIDDQLYRIKAKTLVIHVTNDQWLIYKTIEETALKIKGAQMVGFESPLAHYAIFQAPNVVKKEVISFFKEAGMVSGEKESGPGKSKSLFEK